MNGQQLGPYTVLEEIGSGGMATVYRAYQQSMNRDVAIKIIKKSQAENWDTIQRFKREAHLIARLEHIHILPIYDFDGFYDPPYIVMRYLEGGTLEEIVSQGSLMSSQILYLMRQICSAIDYAHRQGVMHRDLKPSNVMLDQEGHIFVTDFGLARPAIEEQEDLQITGAGVAMGTPDYMPPEQIRGRTDIDQRTDVYSLGVMLFEMLTGQLPYVSESAMDVLMMHMDAPIPSAAALNSELPDTIDRIINLALAKEAEHRFSSVAEMHEALLDVLGGDDRINGSELNENASTNLMVRMQKSREIEPGSAATIPSKQYKTVTALFANAAEYALLIEESTNAESAARNLSELWDSCQDIIGENGGLVLPRIDTELFALWGVETIRENDAEQAVRAALQIQTTMQELVEAQFDGIEQEPLPLNIGLDSGLVLLEPSKDSKSFTATGAAISIANRLMQEASGKILVTEDIFRQVMGIFFVNQDASIQIRGRTQPVDTYRIVAAKARPFHTMHRGVEDIETRLIGRDAELKQLQKAHLNALEDQETQVVTVVGAAGKGKTRLVGEFGKWAELHKPHRIFVGRASEPMLDRPYAFIRDIISFRFEIFDNDSEEIIQQKLETGVEDLLQRPNIECAHMVGQLCGFDLSASPYISGLLSDPLQLVKRARQSFIQLITQVARGKHPVVCQLEDIHFADNDSLDLLNEMFLEDDRLPLLVICTARPTLFQRRAEWGSGQAFHSQIHLDQLDKRDSRELVNEILQKVSDVPVEFVDLLVKRAEGNPYFLEELVKMLIADGIIIKVDEDHWELQESRLATLQVPTTIYGLLEARLDTLQLREKTTLQRAAVIGRVFYDTALKAIDDLDDYHVQDLESVLDKLVSSGFIYRRETSAFVGSVEYTFARGMLLDVIIKALLEQQIRVYNLATAKWLVTASNSRVNANLPLIAQYYERGGENENAAIYLILAGKQDLRIGAFAAASEAFERAYQYAPSNFMLLIGLAESVYTLSGFEAAKEYLQKARFRASGNNQKAEILAVIGEIYSREGHYHDALQVLTDALPLARASDSRRLLSRVLYGLADVGWRQGKTNKAIKYVQESLEIAQDIGDSYRELFALNRLGTLLGLSDAQEGVKKHEEMLELARKVGNQEREMVAMNNISTTLSVPNATHDDLIKAQVLMEKVIVIARSLGIAYPISFYLFNLAQIAIDLQEYDDAQKYLLESLRIGQELNSRSLLSMGVDCYAYFLGNKGETDQALLYFGLVQNLPEYSFDQEREINDCLVKLNIDRSLVGKWADKSKELDFDSVVQEVIELLAVSVESMSE